MSFANTEKKTFTEFKKTAWLELPNGQTIIRILEDNAHEAYIHYIPSQKSSVICLGEDCPICQRNRQIIKDNPKTFRDVSTYFGRTRRYSVNVLDKTPAKVCPACQKEHKPVNGTFAIQCDCGQALVGMPATPLNKVKVLSKGVSLFDQFNELEKTQMNEAEESIPLRHFDVVLSVKGTGQDTKITAIPRMTSVGEQVLPEGEELFDLSNSGGIKLSVEEMLSVMKGVAIRDIFNARKADTADAEIKEAETEMEEIADEVNKLFAED